jgi:ParB family chromosome partitioning protein
VNELTHPTASEVGPFEPQKAKANDARADAVIEFAKRVKDWPLLEDAIDKKLEDQDEFIRWWQEKVRRAGNPSISADPRELTASVAEELTGITHQQVSKWGKWLQEREKYRARLFGIEWKAAMAGVADNVRGTTGTGENEWYTPAEFIEMARRTMGAIDLDPASSATAQKVVQAERFFSQADNGLEQEWAGRVWLNPPYAQPAIAQFADKMVREWASGRLAAAVMLTHNYTDTAWFQQLAHAATAICFTRGRVRFISPDGELASPTQGQAFFYFGADLDLFQSEFIEAGFVVEVRG